MAIKYDHTHDFQDDEIPIFKMERRRCTLWPSCLAIDHPLTNGCAFPSCAEFDLEIVGVEHIIYEDDCPVETGTAISCPYSAENCCMTSSKSLVEEKEES